VDLPDPRAGPGQVRVAVHAAGVNPTDWKLRKGDMGGELPQTTGREVAGVVDEVGKGVTDVAVGDRVFGFSDDGAGAAELTLLSHYAPIPPSLGFAEAAGLPVALETARAPWTRSASGPEARCSSTAAPVGSAVPPSSLPWHAARA
jgi:NADPH:quinone reductase-like Zn-dependent oxidoreductase